MISHLPQMEEWLVKIGQWAISWVCSPMYALKMREREMYLAKGGLSLSSLKKGSSVKPRPAGNTVSVTYLSLCYVLWLGSFQGPWCLHSPLPSCSGTKASPWIWTGFWRRNRHAQGEPQDLVEGTQDIVFKELKVAWFLLEFELQGSEPQEYKHRMR